MKRCCRCKAYKAYTDFNKCRSFKDGLDIRCRACQAAKRKQEKLDAIDYINHPIQAKTWIRDILHNVRRTKTDKVLVNKLYKLLVLQPYCPYTGDKLIPTVNCNLDHKIPLSRGGKRADIKNLQWVSRRYNLAKCDMTDKEFQKFCKLILHNIATGINQI